MDGSMSPFGPAPGDKAGRGGAVERRRDAQSRERFPAKPIREGATLPRPGTSSDDRTGQKPGRRRPIGRVWPPTRRSQPRPLHRPQDLGGNAAPSTRIVGRGSERGLAVRECVDGRDGICRRTCDRYPPPDCPLDTPPHSAGPIRFCASSGESP